MNAGFTAFGPKNYMDGKRAALLSQVVKQKYAGEPASASLTQRLKIKLRVCWEIFCLSRKGHRPSAGALW
jgi:hypothetical protein